MPIVSLMFCQICEFFLIPKYERAMSKLVNSFSLENFLKANYPIIGILLPIFISKIWLFYKTNTELFENRFYKILYCLNEACFMLFAVLKNTQENAGDWELYLPRFIYILTILLFIFPTFIRNQNKLYWINLSLMYNIQILLGNNVCPLSYLLIFIETFLTNYCFNSIGSKNQILFNSLFGYLQTVLAQYLTGHIPRFTHIQLFSGFVGFQKFHYATAPLLIVINNAGPMILIILNFIAFYQDQAPKPNKNNSKNTENSQSEKTKIILSIIAILWISQLTFINAWTATERENLHFADYMAPKFIFDVVLTTICFLLILFKISFNN